MTDHKRLEERVALAMMNCRRADVGLGPIGWDYADLNDDFKQQYLRQARAAITVVVASALEAAGRHL